MFNQIINPFRSKLVQSAGIYTAANAINAVIPFLLIPVLTRYLSPADYGINATFLVLVGFVAPITGLSIHGAIARKYFEKDQIDMPKYVGNCLFILLISSLFISAIFWLGSTSISELAVFPAEWLWAVIIVSIGQFISLVTLTLWQVQKRSVQYGSFQIAITLFNVGFSLWFVVNLEMNWQGRVLGQVVAGVFSILMGLFFLLRNGWIKLKIDYSYVKSALMFGAPLIPHTFGGWVRRAIDRIFINNMVAIDATGIYSVGFQIAMVIGLLQVSFNTAWIPWFYEKIGQKEPLLNLKIVKFTYAYVVGMFILAFSLTYLSPWLLNTFVGKDFRGASVFIFWLAMARAAEAMYYMTCNYIFYSMKTGYVAVATFTASAVHVPATYFLIKMNGTIGAAQASFISSLVLVALVWWFASRLYKMPWLLRRSK